MANAMFYQAQLGLPYVTLTDRLGIVTPRGMAALAGRVSRSRGAAMNGKTDRRPRRQRLCRPAPGLRLVADGNRVVVPTRSRERARHLILLPTVDVVEADVHDPATLARLVRGAAAVVNLVGILNESRRGDFERVHVELPRKLIAACRDGAVPRLLHMSALNADPQGPSRYLRSKGEAEALVAASGLQWTIFQPSIIVGREDSFLNLFAKLQRCCR